MLTEKLLFIVVGMELLQTTNLILEKEAVTQRQPLFHSEICCIYYSFFPL